MYLRLRPLLGFTELLFSHSAQLLTRMLKMNHAQSLQLGVLIRALLKGSIEESKKDIEMSLK